MKTLLICPSERASVQLLSRTAPLAAVPLLGQSLLEYWLSYLSAAGTQEVVILAHDRPEQVQALVGDGARWGMAVSVNAESRELTPAQALLKYPQELDAVSPHAGIALLDHFPGLEQFPLFNSYADLFSALREWLPKAVMPDRVGYRELKPGVWVSTTARISAKAYLNSPCWIGSFARIAPGAVVGPYAFLEDGVVVEADAEIEHSRVGANTLVGSLARLRESLALGGTLINLQSGAVMEVPDPFLLCALRQPGSFAGGWVARLRESAARWKGEPSVLWKYLALNKES